MTPLPFSRAAQAYCRLGIHVFPLRPRHKKPLAFTTGLTAASADPDLAALRWAGEVDLPMRPPKDETERLPPFVRANPACNVACATGAVSGFWVLDLDGPEAEEDLAALVAVHGPLPETVEQGTGKGRHLCFAWDPAYDIRNSASKIGRGIDVRGDGGYIVLPPSIHPSGRKYAWTPGCSPRERAFAPAPVWLLKLVSTPAPAAPSAPRAEPRLEREAGTTRFGRATLATACRMVATAPPGKQQSTLFGYAAFIGAYVAGGEIDKGQARQALIDAGLSMAAVKGAWTLKEVESAVVRGMEKGAAHPKDAPAPRTFQPAEGRAPVAPAATVAEQAVEIRDARQLWDSARPADCRAVRSWFGAHGLAPDALPGGLGGLRAHQRAPLGRGLTGTALLVPLTMSPDAHEWDRPVDAVAVIPLLGPPRIVARIGSFEGKVASLCAWPADGALLVALDFLDAWTLGQNAHENGHELGVILAPSLRAFAGCALGDKWGRLDPRTPHLDPEQPPWTIEGERAVFLAVRGDLRSPEFRTRKMFGGTDRVTLGGEDAARFYGGLAEQAWRRAGANPVRILRPSSGAGFSQRSMGHVG